MLHVQCYTSNIIIIMLELIIITINTLSTLGLTMLVCLWPSTNARHTCSLWFIATHTHQEEYEEMA